MAFSLLQRPALANKRCCLDHQSLPLTSLRWQQHRRIFGASLLRSNICIRVRSAAKIIGDASHYENEASLVERRRQQVESFWIGNDRRFEVIWLGRLEDIIQFYYKHGRLPKQGAKGTAEHSSAQWMSYQRNAKRCLDEGKPCRNKMTPERIATLECMLWWVWDAWDAAWQSQFEELKAYVKDHGKIPLLSHPNCGFWVDTQRKAYKAWKARENNEETDKYKSVTEYMDQERATKLESIPGWSWESQEDAWEAKYQELLDYVEKENKIPSRSDPTLGKWVNNQRHAYKAWKEPEKYKPVTHYMDQERATKLESIPGWKWSFRR